MTAIVLLGLLICVLGRRPIAAALKRVGNKARNAADDRYSYTLEALFWTTLLALPGPLILWFVSRALQPNPDSSAWL